MINKITIVWPRSSSKGLDCMKNKKFFWKLSTVDLGMDGNVRSWVVDRSGITTIQRLDRQKSCQKSMDPMHVYLWPIFWRNPSEPRLDHDHGRLGSLGVPPIRLEEPRFRPKQRWELWSQRPTRDIWHERRWLGRRQLRGRYFSIVWTQPTCACSLRVTGSLRSGSGREWRREILQERERKKREMTREI